MDGDRGGGEAVSRGGEAECEAEERAKREAEKVRHEAAEALGGIGGDDDGSLKALRVWAVKEGCPRVVRESCEVALDMWQRERDETFESVEDSIRNASSQIAVA